MINITTFANLLKKYHIPVTLPLVVIDECHKYFGVAEKKASDQNSRILSKYLRANRLIGLSGNCFF